MALELLLAEVDRSRLRHATIDPGVSCSTAAGFKGGVEPEGATRSALLKRAGRRRPPTTLRGLNLRRRARAHRWAPGKSSAMPKRRPTLT